MNSTYSATAMPSNTPAFLAGQLVRQAMASLHTDHDLAENFLTEAVRLLGIEGNASSAGGPDRKRQIRVSCERARMRPVLAFIHANLGSKLTMTSLGKIVRLSASHFSRAFSLAMGCSPTVYIATKRIELAQSKLESTRESMCSIALACGFADQAHFSKAFSRRAGVSPKVWRRLRVGGQPCPDDWIVDTKVSSTLQPVMK